MLRNREPWCAVGVGVPLFHRKGKASFPGSWVLQCAASAPKALPGRQRCAGLPRHSLCSGSMPVVPAKDFWRASDVARVGLSAEDCWWYSWHRWERSGSWFILVRKPWSIKTLVHGKTTTKNYNKISWTPTQPSKIPIVLTPQIKFLGSLLGALNPEP